VWKGKTIFPGWSLIANPNTLTDRGVRWIIFDKPLSSFKSYVEIDYSTIREECRRCGGVGVENDWVYDGSGMVVKSRDEALLIQELLKITYTIRGSNPFVEWYGTMLLDVVGSKMTASSTLPTTIVSDIQQAFNRWQSIKRQQETAVSQEVTDEEFPWRLLNISATPSSKDPTVMFVSITVQSRSFGSPIQIARGIRMAGSIVDTTPSRVLARQSIANLALGE
jgi:hypothetical protein